MQPDLREKIERALADVGEVAYQRRSHHRHCPLVARVLPDENLLHEKGDIVRKGHNNRVHYVCSNPKCADPIRNDKWDEHVLRMTSDVHLQEPPEDVLERSMNFVADGFWITRERRMQRLITFMEQRHYLALARQHGELDLARRITEANRFLVRLTNMVRVTDPTSQTILAHCTSHYSRNRNLAELIVNIMFQRNTMSREAVKLCAEGGMPWIRLDHGRVAEDSKRAITEIFLQLAGAVFFTSVEPHKSRAKCPRRGWGELVSEIVAFARRGKKLADLWRGPSCVEKLAKEIRKISGFGGKGFRTFECISEPSPTLVM